MNIHPLDDGFRIVTDQGVVEIDTSAHQLHLTVPGGKTVRLGALRAAFDAIADAAEHQVGIARVDPADADAIAQAAYAALRRSADRVGRRLRKVERHVGAIAPTPLIFSFPFLASEWLRDDAAKYRPCQVAVARLEDEDAGALPFADRAEALVDRLSRWRDLYRAPDSAKKAVKKTLAAFGNQASADALWGFRRAVVSRQLPSLSHLEVVGHLGAHSQHRNLHWCVHLVESANESALGEALGLVAGQPFAGLVDGCARDPVHLLAEVLALVEDDTLRSLIDATKAGVAIARQKLALGTAVKRPPIPPPDLPGYTFLESVEAIVAEGKRMQHCVGFRREQAVKGKAYFFHVEDGRHQVTAQVDEEGWVVEVRGPKNEYNPLVQRVVRRLNEWGVGFQKPPRMSADASVFFAGQRVPAGAEALQTARDAYRERDRLLAQTRDGNVQIAIEKWFDKWMQRGADGSAWMVARGAGVERDVLVLNKYGRIVAHTRELSRRRAA